MSLINPFSLLDKEVCSTYFKAKREKKFIEGKMRIDREKKVLKKKQDSNNIARSKKRIVDYINNNGPATYSFKNIDNLANIISNKRMLKIYLRELREQVKFRVQYLNLLEDGTIKVTVLDNAAIEIFNKIKDKLPIDGKTTNIMITGQLPYYNPKTDNVLNEQIKVHLCKLSNGGKRIISYKCIAIWKDGKNTTFRFSYLF